MRRILLSLTLCLLASAAAPAPAHAWLWELIDGLSGPGPFNGVAFEWRLVCFSEPDPALAHVEETRDESKRAAARFLQILGPGCFFQQVPVKNQRRASINLKFGLLKTNKNNITYARDVDTSITLTTLTPTIAWRPTRSVETSFGVGMLQFSGPAFESFRRLYLQPIQVDVKPFALINQARHAKPVWWDELISVRAGVIVVPGGFDAEDFGGVPGTFHVSRDTIPTAAVFLDLDAAVRKLSQATAYRSP